MTPLTSLKAEVRSVSTVTPLRQIQETEPTEGNPSCPTSTAVPLSELLDLSGPGSHPFKMGLVKIPASEIC